MSSMLFPWLAFSGAGDEGGRVVVSGTPAEVAQSAESVTAPSGALPGVKLLEATGLAR